MPAEPPKVQASVPVIVLFTVAALFARSALQIHLTRAGYDSALAADLSFFVTLPIIAILMWPILRENGPAMRRWLRPPVSWPALFAYSVMLGVLCRIIHWTWLTAGIGFGWYYNPDFPTVPTAQFYIACPPAPILALAIFVQAVLTPLLEEVMNRGYILHSLLARGEILAVTCSAVLFSLMHRPQTIVNAFLIGVVLAVLALRLRTLWCPIIVHATYNLAAIIDWNCLHANWNPVVTVPRDKLIACISVATMIVCIALSFWLLSKAKTGTPLAPRPRY